MLGQHLTGGPTNPFAVFYFVNLALCGVLLPARWAWLLGAAATGPFISRLCLMFSLRYISASHSKLVTLTAPVFAFLLGFAVFDVVPTGREAVGSALIVAGVVVPVLELARDTSRSSGRGRV